VRKFIVIIGGISTAAERNQRKLKIERDLRGIRKVQDVTTCHIDGIVSITQEHISSVIMVANRVVIARTLGLPRYVPRRTIVCLTLPRQRRSVRHPDSPAQKRRG
jgi:hypothetical protein